MGIKLGLMGLLIEEHGDLSKLVIQVENDNIRVNQGMTWNNDLNDGVLLVLRQ